MAEHNESICRSCFHSYVCEQFNEHRNSDNKKCHFFNDHFVSTADVAEVRHGEWNIRSEIYQMIDDVDEELFVECPFCQRRYPVPYVYDDEKILEYAREEYPYCHCGAKMDGKGDTQ